MPRVGRYNKAHCVLSATFSLVRISPIAVDCQHSSASNQFLHIKSSNRKVLHSKAFFMPLSRNLLIQAVHKRQESLGYKFVGVTVDVINAEHFSADFHHLWIEKNVFLTSDRAYLFKGPPTALLVSLTNSSTCKCRSRSFFNFKR